MQRRSRTGTSHPGTSHPALQAAISPARLWDMIESQQGIITSQENVISNQRGLLRAQQATITSLQAIGAQQRRQIDKQEVDAVQAKKREQHQLTALKELESIRDAQKDELAARIEEVKKLRTELRAQSTNSLSTTGQAAKEQVQTPNELTRAPQTREEPAAAGVSHDRASVEVPRHEHQHTQPNGQAEGPRTTAEEWTDQELHKKLLDIGAYDMAAKLLASMKRLEQLMAVSRLWSRPSPEESSLNKKDLPKDLAIRPAATGIRVSSDN